jgi:hypothetical protein
LSSYRASLHAVLQKFRRSNKGVLQYQQDLPWLAPMLGFFFSIGKKASRSKLITVWDAIASIFRLLLNFHQRMACN